MRLRLWCVRKLPRDRIGVRFEKTNCFLRCYGFVAPAANAPVFGSAKQSQFHKKGCFCLQKLWSNTYMSGTWIPLLNTNQALSPPATYVIAVGGDARQVTILRALTKQGYKVTAVGLEKAHGLPAGVHMCRQLSRALAEWPMEAPLVLLLPLPVSRDGETVCCPLDPEARIPLTEVLEAMNTHPTLHLLGGCLPAAWRTGDSEAAQTALREGRLVDYYQREDVQVQNARLTAEGAIMTAMECTDTALIGSRAAVIGYGRIGRYLARLLQGLGVKVTICARRADALASAACDGCDTLRLRGEREDLLPLCHGYDVIYNTVPVPLMGVRVMEAMEGHTLVMDLASAPGGVEPEVAQAYLVPREGERRPPLMRVPSLPGRYAPETAGAILAEAVLDILQEGGKNV